MTSFRALLGGRCCLMLTMMILSVVNGQQDRSTYLDNRDTCAHRVINCNPDVDHFETKVTMEHSSSVRRLDYYNTHIILEQAWPTRGPWMKNTTQVSHQMNSLDVVFGMRSYAWFSIH